MMRAAAVLLLWAAASAAADPVLHARLDAPDPAWVGQRMPITVELLTTTTFGSAPVFELPELPGALLMRMDERPTLGTESIDGTEYAVQRHDLALFAMRPGTYEVPPFVVRFASPPAFGQPPVEHRLTTPPLRVEARLPPGAEGLPGIASTREMTAKEAWQPELPASGPVHARVGDAFTRTVTRTARDVPAMAFPPLSSVAEGGVAVYPRPPTVQDRSERGAFTGERIDSVTYVLERSGKVTLRALDLRWWNVASQQLETATLPAVIIDVGHAPLAPRTRRWLVALVAGAALLIGLTAWRSVARCANRGAAAGPRTRKARPDALPASSAAVAPAMSPAYNGLIAWLDCLHRGDHAATIEDDLLARHPDSDLARCVHELEDCVLRGQTRWDGSSLARALRRVRRQNRSGTRLRKTAVLPALNPR